MGVWQSIYGIANFLQRPVTEAGHYRRAVLAPQLFLLLLTMASSVSERALPVTLTLEAAAVVLLVGLLIWTRAKEQHITASVVLLHVALFASLLFSATFLLPTPPALTTIFLMYAGLLLSFAAAGITISCGIVASLVVAAVCIGHTVLLASGAPFVLPSLFQVVPLFAAAGLISTSGSQPRFSLDALNEGGEDRTQGEAAAIADDDFSQIRSSTSRFHYEALAREYAWRLVLIVTLLAAASCVAIMRHAEQRRLAGTLWMAAVFVQMFLLRKFWQRPGDERTAFSAWLVATLSLLWWMLFRVLGYGEPHSMALFGAALVLGLGTLPWPQRLGMGLGSLCAAALLVHVTLPGSFWGEGIVALLLVIFTYLLSGRSYLLQVAQSAHYCLSRYCESPSYARTVVRLLAEQMRLLMQSNRVLIAYGNTQAELLMGKGLVRSNVDSAFVATLQAKFQNDGRAEAIVVARDLGEQFEGPLVDWFSYRPRALLYVRLQAMIEDREEQIFMLVPVAVATRITGVRRVLREIVSLDTLARVTLMASRASYQSSDVLLATQRSVSEKEQELNEIVHRVNNAAQEIAIECENVRTELTGVPPALSAAAIEKVRAVEVSTRCLSLGVSDTKLLRELFRATIPLRAELLVADSVLEEIALYTEHRARMKEAQFTYRKDVGPADCFQVAGREFFESALRQSLDGACFRAGRNGKCYLEVFTEEERVLLEFGDNGPALAPEIVAFLSLGGPENIAVPVEWQALARIVRMSEGTISLREPQAPFTSRVALSFLRGSQESRTLSASGAWALFVDDNAHVTTFYGRVAEAIGLKYFTADSVERAEAILKQHGKPRLVITDLQLGSRSGFELVASLRKQFGEELAVLVVSGNAAEVAQQPQTGATRFLVKPVGRRRLFAEIKTILAQQ